MSKFKAIYNRISELPLFGQSLKVNKIEEEIHANNLKDAAKWAKCDKHKGFELVGIVPLN